MNSFLNTKSAGLILMRSGYLLRTLVYCGLLSVTSIQMLQAAEFDPVDLGEATLQSRRFEQVQAAGLVNASISVIQDISFHVLEVESAPIVIVAAGQSGRYTLTINIIELNESADSYQVRVMLDGPSDSAAGFYQDFFAHLNATYFTARAVQ